LTKIEKWKFAWDMILQEFELSQHRGSDETTATIEKRWKNLKSPSGKYNKEFFFPKFSPSKKTLDEYALAKENEIYEENKENAKKLFAFNFELIEKLKANEVIVNSKYQKTANEVKNEIECGNNTRKNIRDNRLEKYERMAESDQKFQAEVMNGIESLRESMQEAKEMRKQTVAILERFVIAFEKSNST